MPEIIVRTDIFDYGPAFRAYKDGTTDKRKGLLCNHHFLKSLQDQGFFSDPNRTTVVADIGCGEGDTIIKYLKDIQFKGGLDIRALDADPKLVGQGDESECERSMAPAADTFAPG